MAGDEDRHCKVFEIIAAALTDEDTLTANVTVDSLVEQIRAVGEEFLPRTQRRISDIENPIDSGQRVVVRCAKRRDEKRLFFRRVLDECGLREAIRARVEFLQRPVQQFRIAIVKGRNIYDRFLQIRTVRQVAD